MRFWQSLYNSYDSGMLERHLTNVKNIIPILFKDLRSQRFY